MPSFQSPVPISGKPCAPRLRLLSTASAQCSYTLASRSENPGWKNASVAPSGIGWPARNGSTSSSTAASPLTST